MSTPVTVSPAIMAGVIRRPLAPTSESTTTIGARPTKLAMKKRRPSILLSPAT
jgi:hypothetical protein